MAENITRDQLLETGAHFGHQAKRWNPKMKEYIYIQKKGVYIIDLNKTLIKLQEALDFVKQVAAKNKKILFVGTKKQAQEIIEIQSKASGSPYVNQRWLGGTLTNLNTIKKSINVLRNIEQKEASGELELLTKKERIGVEKKKNKLLKFLDGIRDMNHLPGAIFIVDTTVEYNAIKEAQKLKIPIIAICDTNSDPDGIDYVIPANDDAKKNITYMVTLMASAINEAKGQVSDSAFTSKETTPKQEVAASNELSKHENASKDGK